MGAFDIALGWYPAQFGNTEWEFGAISGMLNGFALPMLGLYLILGSSLARGRALSLRILSVVFVLLTIYFLLLAILYATVVPAALNAVSNNALLTTGIRKAVLKAVMLFLTYGLLTTAGAIRGWRHGRRVMAE
jgi:hypothetical protein